jgi:hypothetical protein
MTPCQPQLDAFIEGVHAIRKSSKYCDYFISPAQSALMDSNKNTPFGSIEDLKKFVVKLDEAFGHKDHVITGGPPGKYISL